MSKTDVKFRVDDSQNAWLAAEAKKAGIPKSKILLQLIDAAMSDHAKVNGTSDRMVGTKAMIALLENSDRTKWLKEDRQVLWFEGFIWFVGKTANGCQVQLDRWLEAPLTLFMGMSEYRGTSAKDVKLALANWNELKALDGIELVDEYWFSDGEDFFNSIRGGCGFEHHRLNAIKAIEKAKEALAVTRAALEVANEEMPVEVIEDASTPLNEVVVKLSAKEFRAKSGFDFTVEGNKKYGDVCVAGRNAEGYVADDHSKWTLEGVKNKAVWTKANPATRQVAESKVLSIV